MRALIFDVDGTLAETEEAHRQAFNEAFAEAGLGWHWSIADYTRLLRTTGGKERMRAYRDEIGGTLPDDAAIADLHRWKTARYADLVAAGGLGLRPGVADLVRSARTHGLKMAIATTTSRPNVEALCAACFRAPAGSLFDAIAAGDEVSAKKPAPDVYLLALERLGVTADQAVAFEDSRNGVLAAKAAGLRVVVTPSVYTTNDDFSAADRLLPDLAGYVWPDLEAAVRLEK